jgi:hypothetical protein
VNEEIGVVMSGDEMVARQLAFDDEERQQRDPQTHRKAEHADGRVKTVAVEVAKASARGVPEHGASPLTMQ